MPEAAIRMHRPEAVEIAKAFVAEIEGCCDRLVVAGSLRRRLAYVGDIEIVCTPTVDTVDLAVPEMFGERVQRLRKDRLNVRLEQMLELGEVSKRVDKNGATRWGPAIKLLEFRGAPIDLFAPAEPERFGWILVLRTGPAAFARQLVLPIKDDLGRPRRTKDGRPGLLPVGLRPRDGWLTRPASAERLPTPDETDVFALYDLPYREPWERT